MQSLDLMAAASTMVTGAAADYAILSIRGDRCFKDGALHAAANIVGQVIDVSGFVPVPAQLQFVAPNITQGILYGSAQKLFMETSPFNGLLADILWGTAVSFVSDNVTQRLFSYPM